MNRLNRALSLKQGTGKGLSLILFAALAWGSSFPVIKWGLAFINPLLFLLFRFLIASAAAIPFMKNSSIIQTIKLFKNKFIIFLGVLNAAGYILEFTGLMFTTASKASLLVNVNVVLVALFSIIVLGERLDWKKITALTAGLTGVLLITVDGDFSTIFSGNILGDILVTAAGAVWALYIVYSKKTVSDKADGLVDVNSVNVSWTVIILTTVVFTPATLAYIVWEPASLASLISIQAVFALIYLGLVCTTLAFTLYFKSLKYISATSAGIILLAEIVFALVLSNVFLLEPITSYIIIGGLMICAAVILLSGS